MTGAPTVFILDDDVVICRILHRIFSDEQYQVSTSQSVADAVAATDQKTFDAYVLDYRLPDGSGLDLAEKIRSRGDQSPIIIISGYDAAGIAKKGEALRIFDIVEKPFSQETISNSVKKALGSLPAGKMSSGEQPIISSTTEPVPAKKRSPNSILIIGIILLIIVVGVIIYFVTSGH
jgi:DNA-binding NtrC family response regulator